MGTHDHLGAAHRAAGTVERGEEPVAGGVDLLTPVAREQRPDLRVVLLDEPLPRPVAQLSRSRGRADDVGEEHGCEHAIERRVLLLDRLGESPDRPGYLDDVTEDSVVRHPRA
jgi:hypothetical protein